jgi:diguanylate cyclase (GGDEF)-like protein
MPTRPDPNTAGTTIPRRPLMAVWPLLLVMVLMLSLSIASVLVVSWTRAAEHGLALWAVSEHQAVHELRRYADGGDEAHYQRFLREMNVPASFDIARLQLKGSTPDHAQMYEALAAAGVPTDDIAGILWLFRLFKHFPPVLRAMDLWSMGGALVSELEPIGAQMREEFAAGQPDRSHIHALRDRADGLHARIRPLVLEFGEMMSVTAHRITTMLLVVLPLFAAALVLLGFLLFRALEQRASGVTRALRELTARLKHQASHDALTGLVNRPRFESLLTDALARNAQTGEQVVLIYFDLDQFKVVNDTCGHAAGDELLRQMAWRLRTLVGEAGTLARLGGDEFALLLPGHSVQQAMPLAEQLRQEIVAHRFYWKERTFAVSASIGLVALGRDMRSVADALAAADQACYLAKENGRDRVHLYLPDDHQVLQRRGEMHWVERLQAALDRNQFTLVAQEIRAIRHHPRRDGAPSRRFEVLLRMDGADGELIAPMAFIPAAERYGLMPRIDRWVIQRACRELAALREGGMELPTCMVNLSGASASEPGLADYIADCLRENGLKGHHLGVELTETAAVQNLDACSELMARLRRLGCPIALDDFGSGMSSFTYLRKLPIDYLKIDSAFVRRIATDPIDHAMVETIQRIAGIMGVRTVAEGVETAEVLESLSLIGVDFAQGNWVRRAVPLVQVHSVVGSRGEDVAAFATEAPVRSLRSGPGR